MPHQKVVHHVRHTDRHRSVTDWGKAKFVATQGTAVLKGVEALCNEYQNRQKKKEEMVTQWMAMLSKKRSHAKPLGGGKSSGDLSPEHEDPKKREKQRHFLEAAHRDYGELLKKWKENGSLSDVQTSKLVEFRRGLLVCS